MLLYLLGASVTQPAPASRTRVETIDILRGMTILWIAAFHFYIDTRGAAGNLGLPVILATYERGDTAAFVDLAGRTLVALPSYRLDVLLFVTGLVLSLSRRGSIMAFWRHRARAVMPNYFLPLRLVGPALGMVTALYIHRLPSRPLPWASVLLVVPAIGLLLGSIWYGAEVGRSTWGVTLPLMVGVPALWTLASSVSHLPRTAAVLTWVGAHSMSLLVVQDLMRLSTGTGIALWGRPDPITWYAMPVYVVLAVALTPLWHRVPEAIAARVFRRPFQPAADGSVQP